MAFACPRCPGVFGSEHGVVMHLVNKQDSTHEDVKTMKSGYSLVSSGEVKEVDRDTYSGGVSGVKSEDTPAASADGGQETDSQGIEALLEIEPPVDRSSGSESEGCPDCSGSLETVPPGTTVTGDYQGETVSVETETGDRACPSCRLLVSTGGEVIR